MELSTVAIVLPAVDMLLIIVIQFTMGLTGRGYGLLV